MQESKNFTKKDLTQISDMLRFFRQKLRGEQDSYMFLIISGGSVETYLDIINGDETTWPPGEFYVSFIKDGVHQEPISVLQAYLTCFSKMIFYCSHTHVPDATTGHMTLRESPLLTYSYTWKVGEAQWVAMVDETFLLATKMKDNRDNGTGFNFVNYLWNRCVELYGTEWTNFFDIVTS